LFGDNIIKSITSVPGAALPGKEVDPKGDLKLVFSLRVLLKSGSEATLLMIRR
jgi:hypothetical protein